MDKVASTDAELGELLAKSSPWVLHLFMGSLARHALEQIKPLLMKTHQACPPDEVILVKGRWLAQQSTDEELRSAQSRLVMYLFWSFPSQLTEVLMCSSWAPGVMPLTAEDEVLAEELLSSTSALEATLRTADRALHAIRFFHVEAHTPEAEIGSAVASELAWQRRRLTTLIRREGERPGRPGL
jgi:hypothetical protein